MCLHYFILYRENQDFGGIVPINETLEIILLFVTLVCIILVVKRKLVGALIYLLIYGLYFGTDVFNGISMIISNNSSANASTLPATSFMNLFVSFIGVILPIAVLLDMLVDKGRKNHPKDKKTDWFYTNEQFDRKLDDRADKNNYRTL